MVRISEGEVELVEDFVAVCIFRDRDTGREFPESVDLFYLERLGISEVRERDKLRRIADPESRLQYQKI